MSTFLTTGEAAKLLRRSVKTLQRWDREGKLVPARAPSGRRLYNRESLLEFLGAPTAVRRTPIAYCRVSSLAQRPDLKNQRSVVEDFCIARGLANVEFIEEIGGGLNFKRKKFVKLIDRIIGNEVSHLVLAHQDRLSRFGFDLLEHICTTHKCEIVVINSERLSPEQEMVQDLMTIIHCFSSRLYGLRNYQKSLNKALAAK